MRMNMKMNEKHESCKGHLEALLCRKPDCGSASDPVPEKYGVLPGGHPCHSKGQTRISSYDSLFDMMPKMGDERLSLPEHRRR